MDFLERAERVEGEESKVLEIRDLSVEFRSYGAVPVRALEGVALDVYKGERLGLVGESGSGKTTLARAIMGVLAANGAISSGSVVFEGSDLIEMEEEEVVKLRGKKLAMIVPNPRGELDPLVRVGRQLTDMVKTHLGASKREARQLAMKTFEDVAIPDPDRRFYAYPHELSGGMAQRVVIAMALICSPNLVISDDATSGLDVTVQAQILELLRQLGEDNATGMLVITRDIGIAAHFCDRIGIIYQGHMMEIAKTYSLFTDPRHPYTNMLLAAFSQNTRLRREWSIAPGMEEQYRGRGCPFWARCVRMRENCRVEYPAMRDVGGGTWVRCHYPVER